MAAEKEEVMNQPNREYYLDKLARMRLMDDDFMNEVFQDNKPAVELLLNTVLRRDDISVTDFETQRVMSGRGFRSIRMDIHAVDSKGEEANVEVQRADKGAGSKRARLHSAIPDSSMLKAGQEFDEIADSYVIFITENDIFGDGKPLRSFSRRCDQEPEEQLGDGNYVIYVNGAYKNDDDPIGRLMHDFRCVSAVDMFNPELADKVRMLKETKGGQDRMCKLMEDMRNEAKMEQARETAYELYDEDGFSPEKIAKRIKVSVDTVQKWLDERLVTA